MKIKKIEYYHERIELSESYDLSYSKLKEFEFIKTIITLENRDTLLGEVVPLVGYTNENIFSIVNVLKQLTEDFLPINLDEYIVNLTNIIDTQNCFALSSIIPPLEYYLEGENRNELVIERKDIICFVKVNTKTIKELHSELTFLKKIGHKSIKIKLGLDFYEDIETINKLSKANVLDLEIRFDVNGAYNLEQTLFIMRLLNELIPNCEYLEQPMRSFTNEDITKISNETKIPLMLDESIYSIKDINKAYNAGIKFIKLKLSKFGSYSKLLEALMLAKEKNINVVFGNGVATDISNFYELHFFMKHKNLFYKSSESVGFNKYNNYIKYKISIK